MIRLMFASLVVLLLGCGAGRAVADSECRNLYLLLTEETSWAQPTCLAGSPESGAVACMSLREFAAGYERRSVMVLAPSAAPVEYILSYEADLNRDAVQQRAEPLQDKVWTIDELAAVLEEQALCEPAMSPTDLVEQKWVAVGEALLRLEVERHVEDDWTWASFMVREQCGDSGEAHHLVGGGGQRVWAWSAPFARRASADTVVNGSVELENPQSNQQSFVLMVEEVEAGEGIFERAWAPQLVNEAGDCSPSAPIDGY